MADGAPRASRGAGSSSDGAAPAAPSAADDADRGDADRGHASGTKASGSRPSSRKTDASAASDRNRFNLSGQVESSAASERNRFNLSGPDVAVSDSGRAAGGAGRVDGQQVGSYMPPSNDDLVVVQKKGKDNADTCAGSCQTPITFGIDQISEFRQAVADVADWMVSPMAPGPFLRRGVLFGGSPERAAIVDRLWELRLCVEMLRDILEAYDIAGERDALSTAEETLSAVEETLQRVVELVFGKEKRPTSGDFQATSSDSSSLRGLFFSKDLERGRLTRCLLVSRLGISGLLESVLGEMTDWQSRPSEAELKIWRRWDVIFEQIAKRAGEAPGRGSGRQTQKRDEAAAHAEGEGYLVQCLDRPPPCDYGDSFFAAVALVLSCGGIPASKVAKGAHGLDDPGAEPAPEPPAKQHRERRQATARRKTSK